MTAGWEVVVTFSCNSLKELYVFAIEMVLVTTELHLSPSFAAAFTVVVSETEKVAVYLLAVVELVGSEPSVV